MAPEATGVCISRRHLARSAALGPLLPRAGRIRWIWHRYVIVELRADAIACYRSLSAPVLLAVSACLLLRQCRRTRFNSSPAQRPRRDRPHCGDDLGAREAPGPWIPWGRFFCRSGAEFQLRPRGERNDGRASHVSSADSRCGAGGPWDGSLAWSGVPACPPSTCGSVGGGDLES